MDAVKQIATVSSSIETATRAKEFAALVRVFALHEGNLQKAHEHARVAGMPRIASVFKSAVDVGGLDHVSWSALSEFRTIAEGWLQSLRSVSAFDAMLPSMRRMPLRSRGLSVVTGIEGASANELTVKPISSLTLSSTFTDPIKAAAIVVVTEELLKIGDPTASALLEAELRAAVVAASDGIFLSGLYASVTPTASAGAATANVLTDLAALLNAVNTGATSRLFWIFDAATIKKLVLKVSISGGFAFPDLRLDGGTLFGAPVVVADALPAGAALLVDASQIGAGTDALTLRMSRYGSLQLETTPDSPPVASTIPISLWQRNEVALRCERWFAFEPLRSGAVAPRSGVGVLRRRKCPTASPSTAPNIAPCKNALRTTAKCSCATTTAAPINARPHACGLRRERSSN